MSSPVDTASMLAALAQIEQTIAQMKAALGGAAAVPSTPVKASRAKKDPSAPKKEPNDWIKFTQRVSAALKEGGVEVGVATISKQFASSLKEQNKVYSEWTDDAIVTAWKTWTPPTESKMSKRKSSSAGETSADEAPAAAESAAEEGKPKKERKPMSDEAKAAAAAKRAAKKATKSE